MDLLKGKEVAFKTGSKWFLGKALKRTIKKSKQVKKLADVPDIKDYITLPQFLKDNKIDAKEKINILKNYKVDSIYVKEEPEIPMPMKGERDYIKHCEEWWWEDTNDDCKKCVKICKQSSKVDVIECPMYMEKK